VACVAIQAAAGLLVARAWIARHHTLLANGRWRSTKTTLDLGVLGAFAFMSGRQALATGAVNLGAWHGFNEIIYAREIEDYRSLDFDLRLSRENWSVVVFDRDEETGRWSGLRLSSDPHFRDAYVDVDREGAVLHQQLLAPHGVSSLVRHRVHLEFSPDAVTAVVDGRPLGSASRLSPGRRSFGFRGGPGDALVDNVRLTLASGRTIVETFDAPPGAAWILAAVPCLLVALGFGAFVAVRRLSREPARLVALRLLAVSVAILLVVALVGRSVARGAGSYPSLATHLRASEADFVEGNIQRRLYEIRERHALAASDDTLRILFVGSSQTWGAGAAREDETFVSVLQAKLSAGNRGGRPIELINAGISGTRAANLVPLVEGQLLALRPAAVVINLSHNDRATRRFATSVRRMVEAVLAAGACPILVKEASPRGIEQGMLIKRHADLDRVAKAYELPIVDMHRYLLTKDTTGFLWWDSAHLTSFGQRLVAERLEQELTRLGVVD